MPPAKRPRAASSDSKSSSGSSTHSRASRILSKAGSAAKKTASKVVGFLTPRKSSAAGQQSDTPHRTRSRTSLRSSSTPSLVSVSSDGSNQSSFQLDRSDSPRPSASESGEGSDSGSVIDVDKEGLTREEQDKVDLEKLKKSWTSHIYAFYLGDVRITYTNGKLHHVFTCGARNCKQTVSRNQESKDASSTKNLHTHAKKCWGTDNVKAAAKVKDLAQARKLLKDNTGVQNQKLTDIFKQHEAAGGESFSHVPLTNEQSRAEHVRWVSESLRPFAIVKDRVYRKLMKSGRPSSYIPSPSTVARDVKVLFEKTRERLKKRFQNTPACISLATDAWTSPNHHAYVAVSGHWEENGQRRNCLLDFVEVPKSHDGNNLATVLETVAKDFGIDGKITSITCDNASNNDVMARKLETLIPPFDAEKDRTRCFAHIINLVAKSMLKLFDPPKDTDKDGERDDDDDEGVLDLDELLTEFNDMERTAEENDDDDDIFDEVAHMLADERETFMEQTKEIRSALIKVRTVAKKTIHSTTKLLPAWKQLLLDLQMPHKILPRDVKTRWNSTYDMIVAALKYRRAYREFTMDETNGLISHVLTAAEWQVLEDLRDILCSFKDATLFFSRDSATLATVIPAMDKIDSLLATAVLKRPGGDRSFSAPVKAALLKSKHTLNRYYALAYYSRIYRIALILHPRYKIGYLEDNDWELNDIKDAKQELQDVFNVYKDSYDAAVIDIDDGSSRDMPTSSASNYFDMMDEVEQHTVSASKSKTNELQTYLEDPRVAGVDDVLVWWYRNASKYPVLSRMARDYLSVPPTSVYVERQFSRGRLLISSIRNRMSGNTGRMLMCLGSWSLQGFVDDEDTVAVSKMPALEELSRKGKEKTVITV